MNDIGSTLLIGIGATAVTDAWGLARGKLFGIPAPDYGMVGRWIAHMRNGRFAHPSIRTATPVRHERIVGWSAHYIIGVAFAAMLVGIFGGDWLLQPTLAPALTIGTLTVVAPFFVMQPGMGAGVAASRTPRPNMARLHSLVMHAVFGIGLYLAAWALRHVVF